ncbi:MAG: glycosyltransferase family 2 protein [Thermomicrobiales bacterium]
MSPRPATALALLALGTQFALAARVYSRLQRSSGQSAIVTRERFKPPGRISILVPALNDIRQLGLCLRGLHGQGPAVTDILVIDRGSTDGTADLVRAGEVRDSRIQYVDARPVPGVSEPASVPAALEAGVAASPPGAGWILVVGPATRPRTGLGRSMLGHALRAGAEMFSIPISPPISGSLDAIVRPSLAAAAETRFGLPGAVTRDPGLVRANADCLMIRRDALADAGGFGSLTASDGWEFELARRVAARGRAVGCAEAEDLIDSEPPRNPEQIREVWSHAPALRAASATPSGLLGLAETALVQAAPLPLALLLAPRSGAVGALGKANLVLLLARSGLLGAPGPDAPDISRIRWLAPLADIPVTLAIAVRTLSQPRS